MAASKTPAAPRKRAPRKVKPIPTRTVNGAPMTDTDARAALTACNTLEGMAALFGVSGKTTLRPYVRAKIGHVSREGLAIAKTPDALTLLLDRFAPLVAE